MYQEMVAHHRHSLNLQQVVNQVDVLYHQHMVVLAEAAAEQVALN